MNFDDAAHAYRPAGALGARPLGDAVPALRFGDARLPFLTTLALALAYAVVDLVQRLTPGPDTAFSLFYTLPAAVHVLAFAGLYLAVWALWFAVLRLTGAARRPSHPLMRLSQARAARPILRICLGVVLAVTVLVAVRGAISLELAAQALLLIFTYIYVELATLLGRAG